MSQHYWATAIPYWKILPFVLYVVTYYYVTDSSKQYPDETFQTVAFKALPIISSIFIVLSADEYGMKHVSYKRLIFLGLLFSMAGDACLVWRVKLFIPGLLFFAAAHIFYTLAYGFKPFGGGPTATSCAIIGGSIYFYLYDSIPDIFMKMMVLLYTVLIFMMGWRALVRLQRAVNLGTVCGFAGALLFVVSDFMIAVDKWKFKIKHASYWIMLTYFGAQLLISLSAATYTSFIQKSHKKRR